MSKKITAYPAITQDFIDTDLIDVSKHATQTSGVLIVGKQYTILTYVATDNFTNVATVVSGVINTTGCVFIATGTTPTSYASGSTLAYYISQKGTYAQLKDAFMVPSYVEVDISSAEILAIGGVRKTLLSTPAAGKYYDVVKLVLEYNYNSIAYLCPDDYFSTYGIENLFIFKNLVEGAEDRIAILDLAGNGYIAAAQNIKYANGRALASGLELGTYADNDPLNGNGTIKAKIWYNLHTFS